MDTFDQVLFNSTVKKLHAAKKEIERLQALIEWIIEKIPHRYDCPKALINIYGDNGVCDCWKDDLVREIRAEASGEVKGAR